MSESKHVPKTDVVIMGAGILGLTNALMLAKRGLNVMLIDNIVQQKRSFKVGESLLIFSNPFLRTIGDLDEFLQNSYPKDGVWFVYGMEGKETFENETEWAFQAKVPKPWMDNMINPILPRSMFYDAQIVRPEAEDLLRDRVRAMKNITFLDSAKVKEFQIAEDDASPHTITWEDGVSKETGIVHARWLLDCSGRNRVLAKTLKHASEERAMVDGFQTTAVWAQFDHIEDEMFGGPWNYDFKDGGVSTLRDRCTAHLWGEGYWIWVIRLTDKRISIGVTWDQDQPPPGKNSKEQFWNIINRYPLLTKALKEEHVLEFRQYKNVQYMTDTFVSEKRYGMVGDAGSIIDAYYSQGVSLSFVTSWHIANIMESDVQKGELDREYIDRVNRATRADWHMMRNTVIEKYTSAIKDPRFFILSHLLDFSTFSCILPQRWMLVKLLVETGGDPKLETPWHKESKEYLKKTLYFSQARPYGVLPPEMVHRIQRHLQAGLSERARWRLENGVKLGQIKMIARPHGNMPNLFRMATAAKDKVTDLSPSAFDIPKRFLLDGTEKNPAMFKVGGRMTLSLLLTMYAYDVVETGVRKSWRKLLGKPVKEPAPIKRAAVAAQAKASNGAWGETLATGHTMPDVTIVDEEGREHRLSDYWKQKPTAFVFIRHFACPHCRQELMNMKREKARIERSGGQVVVVTMGTPEQAKTFKTQLGFEFPHVADDFERVYEACGLLMMPNTVKDNLRAISQDVPQFVKANMAGSYGKFVRGGNGHRLGGVFIADTKGRLGFVFRSKATASMAALDDIIATFREMSNQPEETAPEAVTNGTLRQAMG